MRKVIQIQPVDTPVSISQESDDPADFLLDLAEIKATHGLEQQAVFDQLSLRLERRALEQILGPAPAGNIELLRDVRGNLHDAVTHERALLYLGLKVRQLQNLTKDGTLQTMGGGLNKRITVESLLRYKPASIPPNE